MKKAAHDESRTASVNCWDWPWAWILTVSLVQEVRPQPPHC